MGLELSCAFATSMQTPDHVVEAERLGYARVWLYDSPALYPDVWMILAECARRTTTIGIGPAVLVPSLRHPMTNAAAIATLASLAPGRVSVAIGSGFTGRVALGQKPVPWADVRTYVQTLQGLLAGDTVTWEGARIAMLHGEGFGAARPVRVPMLIGTAGPKGEAVARELGDGVIASSPTAGFDRCAVLTFGTVLDDGEDAGSARAVAAAGHAAAVAVHRLWQRGGDLDAIPGGREWAAAIEAVDPADRHLAVHEGHLVAPNERDTAVVTGEALTRFGVARTRQGWHERLATLAALGATEIAYQPAGPDIPRELARFAEVARSADVGIPT
jgi:5,10-methylenetetrahydromethanopterin reductase